MYQIYKVPTKYPIGQSKIFQKKRKERDAKLKRMIKTMQPMIDDSKPANFPLRFSQQTLKIKQQKIKKENEKIALDLLKLTSNKSERNSLFISNNNNNHNNILYNNDNHNINKKQILFKRQNSNINYNERRRKILNKEINKQNELIYKRLKNIKPGIFTKDNKRSIQRRNSYLLMREQARKNDYFMLNSVTNKKHIHSKKHIKSSKSNIKFPMIHKNYNTKKI